MVNERDSGLRFQTREIWQAKQRNGVLYTLLRFALLLLGSASIALFNLVAWPVRGFGKWLDRRKTERRKTAESILVEFWLLAWLAVNFLFALPWLATRGPLPLWFLLLLTLIPLFRLSESLHYLLRHYVDRQVAPRSVGRGLVLATVNFLEAGVIFACLHLANIRLGGATLSRDLPSQAATLRRSFASLLSLDFARWPEGDGLIASEVLSLAALGVGLFIIAVVLAQLINAERTHSFATTSQ